MNFKFYVPSLFLILLATSASFGQAIKIAFPSTRIVIQRDQTNKAKINITGTFTKAVDRIEAHLKTRTGEAGTEVAWTTISSNPTGGVFSGNLTAIGGRYDLEVRGMKNNVQIEAPVVIERVGVGEVFFIVGHSNAAGGSSPSVGAANDMVSSINPKAIDPVKYDRYFSTGNPDLLPPMIFSQLCGECGMAPGVKDISFFWGKLGDLLVDQLKVPILFYSAAFGGTNMEQTYMAAYDIPFTHSFVNYNIRMPYVNIRNGFKNYVPLTGLRAILSGHGVNDRFVADPENSFKKNNNGVIAKTRSESGYNELPWMVAISGWDGDGRIYALENAQRSIILTTPNVWEGGKLNDIDNSGRNADKVHFNVAGQNAAAQKWFDAIVSTSTNFLANSKPLLAKTPDLPSPLPVTLVKFKAKTLENQRNLLEWSTTAETNNDYFEVQRSNDAQAFETIGVREGMGDTKTLVDYEYTDEKPFKDIVYYRLKQVDFDGTFAYSRIIAVIKKEEQHADYIFPNPTGSTVEVAAEGSDVTEVTIIDSRGRIVLIEKSPSQIDVSSLSKGDYIVQAKTQSGRTIRKKMIKL
ncbi:T9SS type A sorting domain-containing protein [Dyadobacter sp. LHD-138]|uniref:T9SS type A sorting domain-containing protein n=1 Tax=Dyadobacter sp. LHD-138 TaxID=3071413 RepID=UPI0027E18F58|nr:T9SS type A sorting domain-containing protein [Dyadobacter sp. LHD-138]MDQ6477395.1 T9SS type A sorting domain-containing protein [Dyadobacter sp. LHD-138]